MELTGQPYVKAQHNALLREATGRTRTSIEYKLQNISAVLQLLGQPWIKGYKPMANFQKALLDGVERVFNSQSELLMRLAPVAHSELAEPPALYLGPPPLAAPAGDGVPHAMQRLVRKFDPATIDARNRNLGKKGELIVLNAERTRLISEDRADLAKKIRWVSEEDGDGAGYDILSFDRHGGERLVEVKTTGGDALVPFFISENERSLSDERPDAFRLMRVYDALRAPCAFELTPPLQDWVHLQATNYRATIR